MAIDYKQIQKYFNTRLTLMVDLVAKGRGIEILLRIADQIKKKDWKQLILINLQFNCSACGNIEI